MESSKSNAEEDSYNIEDVESLKKNIESENFWKGINQKKK
jgi:hypothetical protein